MTNKKDINQNSFYKILSIILGILIFILLIVFISMLFSNNTQNVDTKIVNNLNDNNTSINSNLKSEIAVIDTNLGLIKIELNSKFAPNTVKNFKSYIKNGFYDGLIFHRVIDNFMIQGGGFDQQMVEKLTKAPINLESNNGLKNKIGTIAMARTNNPNSATSQFFINVKDNSFLDYSQNNPGYTVFGKVIFGMDVVNKIKSVKTTTKKGLANVPVENVVIKKIYLEN